METTYVRATYGTTNDTTGVWTEARQHISWKSVFAGFFVTGLCLMALTGLGMAFGGIALDRDTSAENAGIFTGVWFTISVILSLFIGSFYATQITPFRNERTGTANGLLLTAIVMSFLAFQAMIATGVAGVAAGNAVGAAADNPAITRAATVAVEDQLGDLRLRSDASVVAGGLVSRLVDGNTVGARNYLAAQAGITPAQADARIAQLKVTADQKIDEAKEAAAGALKATGWSLFFMVVLGVLSAVAGGILGARKDAFYVVETSPALKHRTV